MTWASLKQQSKIFFGQNLGYLIILALRCTYRFKFEIHPAAQNYTDRPFILTFWHNRQLFMSWMYLQQRTTKSLPISVLISAHADGRIIAGIVKRLGLNSVAGSSSRGGLTALLELKNLLLNGSGVAITPDGPKGPKYKLKGGTIKLAATTGAPLLPATLSCPSCWIFKSWDNMFIPKPFSTVYFYLAAPVFIPQELSAEDFNKWQVLFEEQLNQITRDWDLKIHGQLI